MEGEQKSRLREPTLQGMDQIDAYLHVVMQVHDLRLQSSQCLVQRPTVLKVHLRAVLQG